MAKFLGSVALTTMVVLSTIVVLCPAARAGGQTARVEHGFWDRILKRYVDEAGRVAYARLVAEGRGELNSYLDQLAITDASRLSEAEKLAFWINAYNAAIVEAVLQGYSPESRLSRLRMFRWYELVVAGKARTPHEIEHEILRKRFREPRVHFALVCASTSCPKLRREAYRGERLEEQLDDQARRFINDPRRNRIDAAAGIVELSAIFRWFAGDFAAAGGSVAEFVARYVDSPAKADLLRREQGHLGYLSYDWTLNAQRRGPKSPPVARSGDGGAGVCPAGCNTSFRCTSAVEAGRGRPGGAT